MARLSISLPCGDDCKRQSDCSASPKKDKRTNCGFEERRKSLGGWIHCPCRVQEPIGAFNRTLRVTESTTTAYRFHIPRTGELHLCTCNSSSSSRSYSSWNAGARSRYYGRPNQRNTTTIHHLVSGAHLTLLEQLLVDREKPKQGPQTTSALYNYFDYMFSHRSELVC